MRTETRDDWLHATTEPGGREGNGSADKRWSIRSKRYKGCDMLARISYPQKEWGCKNDTRSSEGECTYQSTPLHTSRCKRCSNSGTKQSVAMCSRLAKGLPTGLYGSRRQAIPRSASKRGNISVSGTPLWSLTQPLYIHQINKLGGGQNEREDRSKSCRIYRRLFDRWEHEGGGCVWVRRDTEAFQGVGDYIIPQEAHRGEGGNRIPRIPLVGEEEEHLHHRRAKKRIQENCEEFIKNIPASLTLEKCNRETYLSTRGHRPNSETRAKSSKGHPWQEARDKSYSHWRGRARSEVVDRYTVRTKRAQSYDEEYDSNNYHGCVEHRNRLCVRDGELEDREKFPNERLKLTYKCERARSPFGMPQEGRRSVKQQEGHLVHRQHYGSCFCHEAGDSTNKSGDVEYHKRDFGHIRATKYLDCPKVCTKLTQQTSRSLVKKTARARSRWRMAESYPSYRPKMGTIGIGRLRLHKGVYSGIRKFEVGKEESSSETTDKQNYRGIRTLRVGRRQGQTNDPSVPVEGVCSDNNTIMEEGNLVGNSKEYENRLDWSGPTRREEYGSMEDAQWTSIGLDRLFNTDRARLWAPRTREKYERLIERFGLWWWKSKGKESEGKGEDILPKLAADIMQYLQYIATYSSGEQVNTVGKILLRIFDNFISREESVKYQAQLKILRRDSNMLNPPARHAADVLRLQDLLTLWRRIRAAHISSKERQAVEILTIAFATTSRVAEIVALTVDDVSKDGYFFTVRTKTYAQTWQKHVKKVSDGCGLAPTKILRERRGRALLLSRSLLFSKQEAIDSPITSAEVTAELKRVTKKVHMKCKITSHSGRKGAAVEALIAGVPVVVIQSLGLWKCLDSLQAYLGSALREQFCVLDLLMISSKNICH